MKKCKMYAIYVFKRIFFYLDIKMNNFASIVIRFFKKIMTMLMLMVKIGLDVMIVIDGCILTVKRNRTVNLLKNFNKMISLFIIVFIVKLRKLASKNKKNLTNKIVNF